LLPRYRFRLTLPPQQSAVASEDLPGRVALVVVPDALAFLGNTVRMLKSKGISRGLKIPPCGFQSGQR
jgi:hypothetical protein